MNAEISPTQGMKFKFNDGGNVIEYWCASFSGKEKIVVNGSIIKESKNYSKNSEHTFIVNGVEYSIHLAAHNVFKGEIECSFARNKVTQTLYRLKYNKLKQPVLARYFPYIVAGIAIGTVNFFKPIPLWSELLFLIAVAIVTTIRNRGRWDCETINV